MPTALREVETVSRERKRRTRSRTISHLDPIIVSTLQPHEYDLDPACISLVCPSCRTWVPIRVAATERATAKLVPHHTETAGTEDPIRCPGSHRLVVINVDMERWRQRLEEGVAETNGRRSGRVVRKPQAKPAPAVMQMIGGMVDDKKARKLEEAHVKGCTTCSPRKDESNKTCSGSRTTPSRTSRPAAPTAVVSHSSPRTPSASAPPAAKGRWSRRTGTTAARGRCACCTSSSGMPSPARSARLMSAGCATSWKRCAGR